MSKLENGNVRRHAKVAIETKTALTRNDDDDDDYQYLAYLRDFNKRGPLNHDELVFRLSRLLIIILGAYVCNLDLMNGYEPYASFQESPEPKSTSGGFNERVDARKKVPQESPCNSVYDCLVSRLPRPIQRSSWRRKLKFGWISKVILATFFIAALILLLDIAYLYKHDIGRLRLKRVQDLIEIHGPQQTLTFERGHPYKGRQSVSLAEYEQVLEKQIEETRHTLGYLGDRFIDWGVINEYMYLNALALGLTIFLIPQWLFTCIQRIDLSYHRSLLDHQDEARRVDALCEDEVFKYLESNRMHLTIRAGRRVISSCHKALVPAPVPVPGAVRNLQRRKVQPLQRNGEEYEEQCKRYAGASDSRVCRSLTQMLTSGAFRPISRSSQWVKREIYRQLTICFLTPTYSTSLIICGLFTLYTRFPTSVDLGETCAYILLLLVGCAFIHFIITFLVSCTTQINLVDYNLKLIYDCIRRNERQLAWLHSDRKHQHGPVVDVVEIVDKINSNYLFVLMTYKIFIRQWISYKRVLRATFWVAFSMAFFVPALLRAHVPYLTQDDARDDARKVRVTGFIISSIVLLPINSLCLPICHLNVRCQKLYKALSSLAAHIIAVRSSGGRHHGTSTAIYNEHAFGVLVREISQPKQMLEQFVVKSLGLSSSFPTLVRLHFWWGLVALSILLDTASGQAAGGGNPLIAFMADPFGVWNFHVTPS